MVDHAGKIVLFLSVACGEALRRSVCEARIDYSAEAQFHWRVQGDDGRGEAD